MKMGKLNCLEWRTLLSEVFVRNKETYASASIKFGISQSRINLMRRQLKLKKSYTSGYDDLSIQNETKIDNWVLSKLQSQ